MRARRGKGGAMPSAHLKNNLATTPTSACRIPIFAPTRRPQAVTAWRVDTRWGWAEITGRLGQQHRDLLDAARMVAEAEEWTADGRMHLKIDPAKLRAAMGGDTTNMKRIEEWIEDMRVASVVVYIKEFDKTIRGGIISEIEDAADETELNGRPGAFDSKRRYTVLSFSSGWSNLVDDDRSTRYPLAQVVALTHGFSQAVARFCLSHLNINETVISLMQKLDAKGRERDREGVNSFV